LQEYDESIAVVSGWAIVAHALREAGDL